MHRLARIHAPLLALLVTGLAACSDDQGDVLGPPAGDDAPALARGGGSSATNSTPRIAFSVEGSGARIYTMNPDGSSSSAINNTEGGTDPAWSPDRSKLAFAIPAGTAAGLYVIGANGNQRVKLYSGPAGAPAWSPDGTKIAFHADVAGGRQLFVVNANGSNLQQATAIGTVNSHPTWSPEGLRIVWFSNRSGAVGLWRMSSNGTNRVRIRSCYDCSSPTWSPVTGDERIAFNIYDANGTQPRAAIGIISSNGSGFRTLVSGYTHQVTDLRPSWSPDATKLVFVSGRDYTGSRELFVVNGDGNGIQRITTTAAHEAAPAWGH